MQYQVEKFLSESQRSSYEKGLVEGITADRAANVLEVLDARGLSVSREQRERVLGCSDPNLLKTWLRRAATVASSDELFVQF
jgi:hypothetical protein